MARQQRRALEETWRHLEGQGEQMPRDPGGRPFVPPGMPSYDDRELGFSFFGRGGQCEDYSNLTLTRTYFGHSTLTWLRFVNTDLSGSRMCWNDFVECDFSEADLSGCDVRAATFTGCKFVRAVLRGVDLRRSYFRECDFTGADLTGAVAEGGILYTDSGHAGVAEFLTRQQQAVMTWVEDGGPVPPGG